MARSLRGDLLNRALRLPEGERVKLARELLESVEQFELGEDERIELREAMAAIDRGEYVHLLPRR